MPENASEPPHCCATLVRTRVRARARARARANPNPYPNPNPNPNQELLLSKLVEVHFDEGKVAVTEGL